jgi:threonyl-tRNA synthetase
LIKVFFPDGTKKEFDNGTTSLDVAGDISKRLASKAIGAEVNGNLFDLNRSLPEESEIKIVTLNDELSEEFYRHTFSHILAQAVIRIYGKENVKLGIGPVIKNGFYYDFDLGDVRISDEDLEKIEKEMTKIISEDYPVERMKADKEKAREILKDQKYKLELLEGIKDDDITFYKQGDFIDLCRGPHMPSTGKVKYFKLTSVSGAYWRGDENNPMLQRVYGTAFAKKSELEEYLNMMEEAKKRDHRKLGPKMGLFSFNHEYAPGMAFFHPKGTIALNELMEFSRKMHKEDGYEEINTPLIMNEELWKISGHWDHYSENMYFSEMENQNFAVKPMNCPGHIIIYKSGSVSYRDLPIKMFEFGKVHRYERSGALHGLFRVRGFTQDDAHIFCTMDGVEEQIKGVIKLVDRIYKTFDFEYRAELSTRPEDYMGDPLLWDKATEILKTTLEDVGLNYKVNEGDGAFYGPKIDYHIKDSLGREWQCATIQLDFMMPEKFHLKYIDNENQEVQPVMIHRTVFGSTERFFGILTENFAGAFPSWFSPVHVILLPIADRHVEFALGIQKKFSDEGLRVEVDERQKSTNFKVRDAQMNKVPYILVIGDKEIEKNKLSVRTRNNKQINDVEIDYFCNKVKEEIDKKMINSIFE